MLPALDARLERPAGIAIGLPSDVPPPMLQLEWSAPFGVVRRALHELKYGGEQRLAGPLGAAIGRRWRRVGAGGDLLVPVPVHAERPTARLRPGGTARQGRGRRVGPAVRAVLERTRATIAQFDLDRSARATNVPGAFRLPRRRPTAPDPGAVAGRWVVLIDDVVTTGASLAACAAPLLEAGAVGVSAITVAGNADEPWDR